MTVYMSMKRYKKLYQEEQEKVSELKRRLESAYEKIKEKEIEPYSVDIYFDEKEENIAHIENVIKHETNYKPYPDCRPENWIITTADGLTSVFDYDKVVYILAYREKKMYMSVIDRISDGLRKSFQSFNGE